MISLRPPSRAVVERLIATQQELAHTYPDVGATRGELPQGWNVDRTEALVGDSFERAREAIDAWAPFDHDWIRAVADGPPREGRCVAVVARVSGLWWVNVSRVVYTIDEPGRYGFAYGTLPLHAESGEELFLVERTAEGVRYRIVAFSRPHHPLARLGGPLARRAQRRFARGSVEAMRAFIAATAPARPVPPTAG